MMTNKVIVQISQWGHYCRILYIAMLFLLFQGSPLYPQSTVADNIAKRFDFYTSAFPREEMYVHCDRKDYIAGEDVWFSFYLIDRKSNKPSAEISIAYFEILNPDNRPVIQRRFSLEGGTGSGHVVLPDTLSSGLYMIRAYTSWMKNFMPQNCFTKFVRIYNPLNRTSFSDSSYPSGLTGPEGKAETNTDSRVRIRKRKTGSAGLVLDIISSRDFRMQNGPLYYLFIQTRGNLNYRTAVTLSSDSSVMKVPGELIPGGINHITLFTASGRPLYERYIYTPLPETGAIILETADNAGTREKVDVKLVSGEKGNDLLTAAALSVSVAPVNSNSSAGMRNYLVFGSEFGVLPDEVISGGIEKMSYEEQEAFLSGLSGCWIDWDIILGGSYPELNYRRETKHHYLRGCLLNSVTRIPDPGRTVFLSIPGKNATFQYAVTGPDGYFTFSIPVDGMTRDLIIQPEETDRGNTIVLETPFSERYLSLPGKSGTVYEVAEDIERLSVNHQVMKIYRSDDTPVTRETVGLSAGEQRFYGKPDIEIVLDDFIKLPVMQEIFFELLPGVNLRKRKDDYEITIFDPVENQVYDKAPLLLIDGVVINDAALIAGLDPELVEKIDALKCRYFVGEHLLNGIVNVITRAGDFSNIALPDHAVRLAYTVTESSGEFPSPDYLEPVKRKSRIPDFRNLLYWNPSVMTDSQGKASFSFWTSDIRCGYEIVVEGISEEGMVLSTSKVITVR